MPNSLTRAVSRLFLKFARKMYTQEDWENITLSSLHQMNYGTGADFTDDGELFAINYIKSKLETEIPVTIFDVGANKGEYTKALSEMFGTSAIIHSFEPSADTFSAFQKTTGNLPNVVANNIGFSDKEEVSTLYSTTADSGLSSVYCRNLDHLGIQMDKTEQIHLTTIDSYCEAKNVAHIHFLKLDIEGHELSALRGAADMIHNKKIDFIQFEFGGCNIDSRTFFRDFYYFLNNNYTIYRVLKNGLYELPCYKESFEIFITTNYLALQKN